jgi:hypothetical protein
VLEDPPGISRVINLCLEDLQAHIRAWLQKRSQEPATGSEQKPLAVLDGVPIEPTPVPKRRTGKKSSYLEASDNALVRTILTEHGVCVGAPDAPVLVTAALAKKLWRWSGENASRAEPKNTTLDRRQARLRAAFTRCTQIVPGH